MSNVRTVPFDNPTAIKGARLKKKEKNKIKIKNK
jgi:hypothetical protein